MKRVGKQHLIILLLGLALFSACCKDKDEATKQQPLVLMEQAYTSNTKEPTILHNAQEIGVFLVDSKNRTPIDSYINLCFFADNRSTTGYLVPTGSAIYLKENETVDAISYFPYTASDVLTSNTTSQYLYRFDLSDQKKVKVDGFLYADNVKGLTQTNYKGTLELKPVLSQVELDFIPGYGVSVERLKKMTLQLCGMQVSAQFNLLMGEFLQTTVRSRAEEPAEQTPIPLEVTDRLTATAIIYSSFLSNNVTFRLTLPKENDEPEMIMTWSLNKVVPVVDENTIYRIQIKFGENGVTGTLIDKSSIYISDWNKDKDFEDNLD